MLKIKDAYIHCNSNEKQWTIGTSAVEQVFECENGQFRLASYKNKLTSPVAEYIDARTPSPFFELEAAPFMEQVAFEHIWSAQFARRETVLPIQGVLLQVHEGDVLVFRLDRKDDVNSSIQWNIALDYEDEDGREAIASTPLSVETMYTVDKSGSFEKLTGDAGEIPGATRFNFGTRHNLMRLWKAPRSGSICIGGSLVSGSHGDTKVSIQLMRKVRKRMVISSC